MTRSNNWKLGLILLTVLTWTIGTIPAVAQDDGGIPQRSDIEDKYKWRVEDMYKDLGAWEADYELLKASIGAFDQYRGNLGKSRDLLLGCLKLSDSLNIINDNLYVYAYLKLDEDNRRSEFQELAGRTSALETQLYNAIAFIEPEILSLDAATLDRFVTEGPELEPYRFFLRDLMRQKAHILSPEEEALLASAGPVLDAPSRIFNMIDNADHKMGTMLDADGNVIELTRGRYYQILKGTDRELRRIANDTVQTSWLRYINSCAGTLGGSLNKDYFLTRARDYNTCLEGKLDGDSIPTEVFHSLVKAVNDNIDQIHKLTRLRKRVLGYDTLHTYDLSVSLVPDFEKQYTYEEATALALEGLKPMGEKYLEVYKNGINSGWIDVFETEGKGSGAYSWGTYTSHPYILLNWANMLGDMFTLVHEMGHALHSYYTNRNEPYHYQGHTMFTAEVASTCNEAVLMKYLLANAETKEEKMVLLDYYIKQIDGTFITQVMFSEFELAIHERIESGDAVSVDYFRKTYRDIFQKYYGPDLVIGENNDLSGMKVSHFYRQYYVYCYATSYAAAQMLSQKILEGDQDALNAYMNFLAQGRSQYPVNILKDAGVDMTSGEAVERTLKLFGELIDEMEQLLFEEG